MSMLLFRMHIRIGDQFELFDMQIYIYTERFSDWRQVRVRVMDDDIWALRGNTEVRERILKTIKQLNN